MIVVTSMDKLPHSCMSCPFQKNRKTPFCRAKRNYLRTSLSNTPSAFGFYIKDDAFLEGQTPWNARAKWCPLVEVPDRKTESDSEKPNNCKDEARIITDGTYLYAYDKMPGEWRPIQDISGHKQTERSSE